MNKKILIVDDDPDIIAYTTTVLEENNYTPIIAKNGEEGIKLIKNEKPDLIILDVLMPKQSGIKIYRELKTSSTLKNIPVIIQSGIAKRTFLRSQEALTESGDQILPEPEDYLEKPVEPDELIDSIKKLI